MIPQICFATGGRDDDDADAVMVTYLVRFGTQGTPRHGTRLLPKFVLWRVEAALERYFKLCNYKKKEN